MLERDGIAVGALDVGQRFEWVEPVTPPELYIRLVITARAHAGQGLGALLIDEALAQARERSAELLRVDCWAGAPTLVAWYESQGFSRTHTFTVRDWDGQVLERAV